MVDIEIIGIIKNIKNNLVLNKNTEEKIIKEINLKEEDLLKIKLTPAEDDQFYVLDDSSSSLLDEWLSIEGKDVPSSRGVTDSKRDPLFEDFDPDKTEELTGFDDPFSDVLTESYDPFATAQVAGANLDKEDLDATLEPFGSHQNGGIRVEASAEEEDWEDDFKFELFSSSSFPPPPTSPPPSPFDIPPPPPFETQLETSTLGMYQAGFHTPDPIDTDESVLDMSVKELESMPIMSLRTLLIDE